MYFVLLNMGPLCQHPDGPLSRSLLVYQLIVMLNNEFNAVAANPELDLYPKELRLEIDAVNEWVGKCINAGKLQRQFCFHSFLPGCEAMFLKICFRSVCCRVCKGARQI